MRFITKRLLGNRPQKTNTVHFNATPIQFEDIIVPDVQNIQEEPVNIEPVVIEENTQENVVEVSEEQQEKKRNKRRNKKQDTTVDNVESADIDNDINIEQI